MVAIKPTDDDFLDPAQWMSLKEFADILGMKVQNAYNRISTGEDMPEMYKFSSRLTRLYRPQVQAWMHAQADHTRAQLDALRVGPPIPVPAAMGAGAASSHDEPFMGPMLSAARLETFLADCAAAKTPGAEPLRPSGRLGGPLAHGYFVSPSLHLIRQRQPTSRYQREELLGPDLALYPVVDIDDALQLCDSGPYGLCAAMFTDSPLRWKRFSEEVRAGSLFWNRGTAAPSGRLPFGGVKGSGYGGRGGADALLALRREVSLLGQSRATPERLPGSEPLPSPPRRSESEA